VGRPSRILLFLGATLGLTLPFAESFAAAGPAGFLKDLAGDRSIWATAGAAFFLLAAGIAGAVPAARRHPATPVLSAGLYGTAVPIWFLCVFAEREPLFNTLLRGASSFWLLLPLAGGGHLLVLIQREMPWALVGFWARIHLAGLILLAGGLALADRTRIGGALALAAGALLAAGEVLARREEAFEEQGEDAPSSPPGDDLSSSG
jgi:hypothetical protein